MNHLEKASFYFDNNKNLIENFSRDLSITTDQLKSYMLDISKNDTLIDMVDKVHEVSKVKPNVHVNFGEYGAKVAKDCNLEQDYMYSAIMACSYNELLISIVKQLKLSHKS